MKEAKTKTKTKTKTARAKKTSNKKVTKSPKDKIKIIGSLKRVIKQAVYRGSFFCH